MRKVVRFAAWTLVASAVALVTTGCATKQYVNERDMGVKTTLAARIDEIDREAKALRAELGTMSNRLAAAEGRLGTAEGRLGTAEGRLGTAEKQIAQTQANTDKVAGTLDGALANRFKREKIEELTVLFSPGKATLSKDAQQTLDDVVAKMTTNPTYTLDVAGHADVRGTNRNNMTLSWRRTEMVRRRLVEAGIDMNRVYFIGYGEEFSKGKTRAEMEQDRHVDITLYKPIS